MTLAEVSHLLLKQSLRPETYTQAQIQRNHSPGKHAHEQAEKTLDEKKKPSMDISPLLDDDASTLWSADEPGPKQMGSSTHGRIRRFLHLRRHRRREAPETGADAGQTSSSSKKTQKTPFEEQRDVADKDSDGSTLGWTYNLAVGLAWYLPAPFDMMPQGYPSRVF